MRSPALLSLACSALFVPFALAAPARAASVLLVSDSGADTNIATALGVDGHTVTTVTMDFSGGSNPTLRGSLAAYDVVIWSATGSGFGDVHTDAMVFSNLTTFVMGGGHVFVTGYDSIASPDDPMLISFLGGTGSIDVPGDPGPVAMISNALTEGIVDIRGMPVVGAWGDRDVLTGIGTGTVAVVTTAGIPSQPQWTLRTLGSGLIAYVSNGEPGMGSHPGWTMTGSVFNGAVRNFVFAADRGLLGPCMGLVEGAVCTPPTGPTGICHAGRCCTGCWDGTRCRAGTAPTVCGIRGGMCRSCADGDLCSSDVCTAGVCSNPDAPMGTSCDDGRFCTRDDACNATGTCVGAGARCDDFETCTTDSCTEATDTCTNAPRADGAMCTIGTGAGLCHSARCCTGCWDGSLCQTGNTAAYCGVAGGACRSCVDAVPCSSDVCTTGVCSNPDAPSGTPCDDGMFCTRTDTCNGMRTCIGGGTARCDDGAICTVDTCDEAADMCIYTADATTCSIGGTCIAPGTVNPTYPCLVCDPVRSTSDWSPAAAGTECGMTRCVGSRLTMRACDDAGTCIAGSTPCPTGVCADATSCEPGCTPGSCPAGEWCDSATSVCAPLRTNGDACSADEACESDSCVDGVCCESACDGACESCVAGTGACDPVPSGLDPDDECDTECDGSGGCLEPGVDGGVGRDGGGAEDAAVPSGDGGVGVDGGSDIVRDDGGCGCVVVGARGARAELGALFALALFALVGHRRRRR